MFANPSLPKLPTIQSMAQAARPFRMAGNGAITPRVPNFTAQTGPAQVNRMMGRIQSGQSNPLAALNSGQSGGVLQSLQQSPQIPGQPQQPAAGLLQSLQAPTTAIGSNVAGDYSAAGFQPRPLAAQLQPGQAYGLNRFQPDPQTGHPMLGESDRQRMMQLIQGWSRTNPDVANQILNPTVAARGQVVQPISMAELQRMIDAPGSSMPALLQNPNMLLALQNSLGLFTNPSGEANYGAMPQRNELAGPGGAAYGNSGGR